MQQLDAIFVMAKLQLQNRLCKPSAIFSVICRRDIAGVSNMFKACCNFSATKIASSCCEKNCLYKWAFRNLWAPNMYKFFLGHSLVEVETSTYCGNNNYMIISVFPKTTEQWSRPELELRPLDQESSTITIRPLQLHRPRLSLIYASKQDLDDEVCFSVRHHRDTESECKPSNWKVSIAAAGVLKPGQPF